MKQPSGRRATDPAVVAGGSDAWEQLHLACAAARDLGRQLELVLRLRDEAMTHLHSNGVSYRTIAVAAGLTRGRVAQIVRAATDTQE